MKFGGTSIADAQRIVSVAGLVRDRRERRPAVVVSALAGVTDLLARAVGLARGAGYDAVEPTLAELERVHRWALSGSVEQPARRHRLSAELGDRFEELRQLLRAIRTLGEGSPRAADALLAFGEGLSGPIVTAALRDRDVRARWIDPRRWMVTDRSFGAAVPDLVRTRAAARELLLPVLEAGEVPVTGGFVGRAADGETTTLGRGGSDTTASCLAAVLDAEEIQIWTDVAGLMSADPRSVPTARTLARASYDEAAELAFYGARVLHPSSIAPARERSIPIRVLNSFDPGAPHTRVDGDSTGTEPRISALASRADVQILCLDESALRRDRSCLGRVLAALGRRRSPPQLVVGSEMFASVVVARSLDADDLRCELGLERLESLDGRAVVCVVGAGLARSAGLRARVLRALSEWDPELVGLGASGNSVTAALGRTRLDEALCALHDGFFGEVAPC